MVHVPADDPHEECVHLPRAEVRFPIEWKPPAGFRPSDPATWPRVEGRLEYLDGRIRYMPPCGGVQQDVASAVTAALFAWVKTHPELVVGSNEAGVMIGEEVRAADVAIWRRADAGQPTGFRRVAPVLAVEIAGKDEEEPQLREKAAWYLGVGTQIVWLILPDTREVVVLTAGGETRHKAGTRMSASELLPGLEPDPQEFFAQLG
jgi:Uma2 family endonuclease